MATTTTTQTLSVTGSDDQPMVSFHFISDLSLYDNEKPFEIWRETEPNVPKSNCEFQQLDGIKLHNMRTTDLRFDYDTTGFKHLHAPSTASLRGIDCAENEDNPRLNAYLEETIALAKAQFNSDEVICFDWRYRKSTGKKQINVYDHTKPERTNALNPAHVVHFDDSPNGGEGRLRRYLDEKEVQKYDQGGQRIRFVNIWRPLIPVVEDAPLALCDRQSVRNTDMLECDKIHEDHVGEGLYLKHRAAHRWYWLPRQTSDEALVFLTWDSKWDPNVPAGPPHAAFDNPLAPSPCPPRESIEVRLMVFTDEA